MISLPSSSWSSSVFSDIEVSVEYGDSVVLRPLPTTASSDRFQWSPPPEFP